jgi:hypothetical protein
MRIPLFLLFSLSLCAAQTPNKGKQIIDDAISALGGPKFLAMKNHVETGRAYSFYRQEVTGLSIATIYTEYLNSIPPKGLGVRERQSFGKKKEDYAILFLPDQGFQLTFRGARPLPDDRWQQYFTTTSTNIFYLLRERHNDPKVFYDFVRSDVARNTQVNIVDIDDSQHQPVRIYFDEITKLPLRQEYTTWDPIGKQRSLEVTDYSKYRNVDGIQWPYVTHRARNGETLYEMFADKVEIDRNLPAKTFALPPGIQILKKLD